MEGGWRHKPPTSPSLTRHLCTLTKQLLPLALVLSFALPSDWIGSRMLPPPPPPPPPLLLLCPSPSPFWLFLSFFLFFTFLFYPYLFSPASHLLPATSPLTLLLLTVALATCCGKFLRHNTVLHTFRTCTSTHTHMHRHFTQHTQDCSFTIH